MTWRIASFCQSGECAQATEDEDGDVLVRSSITPEVVVELTPQAWQDLVRGIQAGEFDDLLEEVT
jgi:hypothetical protein